MSSDRGIADTLGVAPSQITRWRGSQTPDPEHADRVAALALVVEMLTRTLHPEVIEGWLRGPNLHLSNRAPAFTLRNHQLGAVVGAVEAMKAGTYACRPPEIRFGQPSPLDLDSPALQDAARALGMTLAA